MPHNFFQQVSKQAWTFRTSVLPPVVNQAPAPVQLSSPETTEQRLDRRTNGRYSRLTASLKRRKDCKDLVYRLRNYLDPRIATQEKVAIDALLDRLRALIADAEATPRVMRAVVLNGDKVLIKSCSELLGCMH